MVVFIALMAVPDSSFIAPSSSNFHGLLTVSSFTMPLLKLDRAAWNETLSFGLGTLPCGGEMDMGSMLSFTFYTFNFTPVTGL